MSDSFATEKQKQKVNGKHQLPLAEVKQGKEVVWVFVETKLKLRYDFWNHQ